MSAPPDPTERAIVIRDHLLPLIREHGAALEISGPTGRMAAWKVGRFTFALHSPGHDGGGKPMSAWGLDVWHGGKVLSLRWDDPGAVDVLTFIRGPWEDAALVLF